MLVDEFLARAIRRADDRQRAELEAMRGEVEAMRRASLDADKAWWDGFAAGLSEGCRAARRHG